MIVSEIVTLALRMARIVPLRDTPTANEAAMGLELFQAMFDQWAVSGMFGKLTDVEKSASYAPTVVGERIRISSGTVTLPDTISRGEDLAPYDLSMIEVIHTGNTTRAVHIYDQTRGDWVQINDLALTDVAPLWERGSAGLAACLAVSYAETFGKEMTPALLRNAGLFMSGLQGRYSSDHAPVPVDYY